MKFFTNKSIWTKIIIVLIFVILFEFCVSRPVQAEDDGIGGKLLSPIVSLVLALGDGVVNLLHDSIMGQSEALIHVEMETSLWEIISTVVVGVVVGVLALMAIVATAGGAAALIGLVTGVTATISIGTTAVIAAGAAGFIAACRYNSEAFPEDLYLPIYSYSPEEIFKGNILLFDVDFFNPITDIYMKTNQGNSYNVKNYTTGELAEKADKEDGIEKYYYKYNGEEITTSKQNTANELQGTVSKWYMSIRNIVLVLMMSVLLYIGIRMLLTTLSSEKAKYKSMLKDWFVSICLIFLMHYIMAFSVTIVKNITLTVSSLGGGGNDLACAVVFEDDQESELIEKLKDIGMEDYIVKDENGDIAKNENGEATVMWPTNLMGKMRIQAQMSNGDTDFIGYTVCFLILVFYTIFFSFTYLKRVLYLAFLTIIAPLVTLTYTIDKLNDGQAQGFNKWLKEYLFNLLIQPLHLILYTVLISAAVELAGTNIIYSLVAIGFLIPAEKLLRSLFGFEKASTPGSLAGAAIGGGLVNSTMNRLLHARPKLPGKEGSGGGGESSSSSDDDSSKINFADNDFDATDTMAASLGGNTSNQSGMNAGTGTNTGTDTNTTNMNNTMTGNTSSTGGMFNRINGAISGLNQAGLSGRGKMQQSSIYQKASGANNRFNKKHPLMANGKKKIRGVGRVASLGARKLYAKKGEIAKKGIKMAGGAALGVAAGTVVFAAGAATGDLGNAVQYGAATLGAGAVTGSKLVGAGMNTVSNLKQSEDLQRAYYGNDYQKHAEEQAVKDWKKQNRESLIQQFGNKETSRMLADGTVDSYLKGDVTSAKDMKILEELQTKNIAKNIDEAKAIHKYASRTTDTTKMKAKDKKEWQETFSEEYQDKNYDKNQADQMAQETFNKINEYYKLKNK